jgi:hypothetical protein
MLVPFLVLLFVFLFYGFSDVLGFELYSKESSPNGIPYNDWIAKWWNWWISVPNPGDKGFSECTIGEINQTVLLMNPVVGEASNRCTISTGHSVLLTSLTGECDTGSDYTRNYKTPLDCAIQSDEFPEIMGVTIDGTKLGNLSQYEVKNENFKITIPTVNWYDIPTNQTGVFDAGAHGYFVFLKPLTAGTHTIDYNVILRSPHDPASNFSGDIKYILTVVPQVKG